MFTTFASKAKAILSVAVVDSAMVEEESGRFDCADDFHGSARQTSSSERKIEER
jgi:hypothetical protein